MFWQRPHAKVLPPRVSPTVQNVRHQCCEYVVPHIHPSHTTNVTHHNYKHVHSFPHTESFQQAITHQNLVAPAPTMVSPAGMGPGFGPTGVGPAGMGPGFGPTGVGPAGMGPGYGPTGMGPAGMGPMGKGMPHGKKPCC